MTAAATGAESALGGNDMSMYADDLAELLDPHKDDLNPDLLDFLRS